MEDVAPTAGQLHKVKQPSDDRRSLTLRTELREAYTAATGIERSQAKQLDHMEHMIRYLARVAGRENADSFVRSIPQIAKGLGWPVKGLTVRQIRDRYEDQITNTLRYLDVAGYVDHVERDLRRADQRGIGIRIFLPAGVAQSVRAAEKSSRPRFRRRPGSPAPAPPRSSSGQFPPPVGVKGFNGKTSTAVGARDPLPVENPGSGSRDRAVWLEKLGAALIAELRDTERAGSEIVAQLPWIAAAPADVLARAAFYICHPRIPGKISLEQQQRLVAAASQLERTGYAGIAGRPAAAAAILDVASDLELELGSQLREVRPRSFGAMAVGLRRVAHRENGWARARARRRRAGEAVRTVERLRSPVERSDRAEHLERGEVVDVPLGGREAGVPELLADHVHADALAGELGGVGVPQPVRVDPLVDPGLDAEILERLPDHTRVHPAADVRAADDAEHRRAGRDAELAPAVQPHLDHGDGLRIDRDDPALVALPVQHRDRSLLEVDVLRPELKRLGDPEAGAPEGDDQRPVSRAGGAAAAASADQAVDLVRGENLGGVLLTGVRGLHAQTVAGEGDVASAASVDNSRAAQSLLLLVDVPPEGSGNARAPDGGLRPPPETRAQPTQENG